MSIIDPISNLPGAMGGAVHPEGADPLTALKGGGTPSVSNTGVPLDSVFVAGDMGTYGEF